MAVTPLSEIDTIVLQYLESRPNEIIQVKEVAEHFGWPYSRTYKLLQSLEQNYYVSSYKFGTGKKYTVSWMQNPDKIPSTEMVLPPIRIGQRPPLNLHAFFGAVAKNGDVPLFSVSRKIQYHFIQIIGERLKRSIQLNGDSYRGANLDAMMMLDNLIEEVSDFLKMLRDLRAHPYWWKDSLLRLMIHDKNFPNYEAIDVAMNVAEEKANGRTSSS